MALRKAEVEKAAVAMGEQIRDVRVAASGTEDGRTRPSIATGLADTIVGVVLDWWRGWSVLVVDRHSSASMSLVSQAAF